MQWFKNLVWWSCSTAFMLGLVMSAIVLAKTGVPAWGAAHGVPSTPVYVQAELREQVAMRVIVTAQLGDKAFRWADTGFRIPAQWDDGVYPLVYVVGGFAMQPLSPHFFDGLAALRPVRAGSVLSWDDAIVIRIEKHERCEQLIWDEELMEYVSRQDLCLHSESVAFARSWTGTLLVTSTAAPRFEHEGGPVIYWSKSHAPSGADALYNDEERRGIAMELGLPASATCKQVQAVFPGDPPLFHSGDDAVPVRLGCPGDSFKARATGAINFAIWTAEVEE